jgi:hypothetical protein
MKKLFALFLLMTIFTICYAQNGMPKQGMNLKVYVSGSFTDMQYLKKQIPVVDYVNDRKDSDVHVLVTSQSTGSSGSEYKLLFYGQKKYENRQDTITVITNQFDSEDIVRSKLAKGIKMGLISYLHRTDAVEKLNIEFADNEFDRAMPADDPWDSWVFRTSFNGFFNGEASSKSSSISGSFSANRTTEDLRLSLSLNNSYKENMYSYDIDGEIYEFTNITRSLDLGGSLVKSLSNHWSLGVWGAAAKSTYGNIDFSWSMLGGIEYNLFPYSDSFSKQLRFAYKIGPSYNKYFEETIFFKESEYLYSQSASINLSLTQPWGSVSLGISGSNYLHDINKYYLSFDTYFSIKLLKGLSLNCMFDYSKIRNQMSLARSGASVEDVLLRIRQLETQYSYFASVGLSFSFGSIFNSIVNPRFGGGGGSGTVIYFD